MQRDRWSNNVYASVIISLCSSVLLSEKSLFVFFVFFVYKKSRNVRPYIPAAKFPKREHVELLTTNV